MRWTRREPFAASPAKMLGRLPIALFAVLFLAVFTYVLYHDALDAFWRFDDGAHLSIVTKFTPVQYFFIPEVTRVQSGPNVTPWNAFTYSVNLALFGFNPKGFYAHELFSVCLAGICTFFLLRLWVKPLAAFLGAALFLGGPPTMHIANELMTGHYLEGLIFAICGLYFFMRAVQRNRYVFALLGGLFYLITVTTKEVYVPLVVLLLFLPEGSLKKRLKFSVPYLIVILAYIPWRYLVQGQFIGGYKQSFIGGFQFWAVTKSFLDIPAILFGRDLLGTATILVVLGLFLVGLFIKRVNPIMLLVCFALLLIPLMPLANWPGIRTPDRYLFLPWWALSCAISFLVGSGKNSRTGKLAIIVMCSLVLLTTLRYMETEHATLMKDQHITEECYRFLLSSNSSQIFLRPTLLEELRYFHYILDGIIEAEKKVNPHVRERAKIISREEQLSSLDLRGKTVWRFDGANEHIVDITQEVPAMIAKWRKSAPPEL
jgi:hypothetical protein